ncbi:MAG: hypothetical protein JSV16_03000 [Candidatus Hydrogenedentota bacterium]|nr:MAG: hypothetical protein JSV16_03000 [Candidatus Hydrogenedentota bacterium]
MPDTNTKIVREFLEANDFSVITNRKFQLQKAEPPGRYSIDILGRNMQYSEPEAPLPMRLQAEHMRFIPNVIVDVTGWHTHRLSISRISTSPELFYFVSPQALEFARSVFGNSPFKSVLIISEVPADPPIWSKMEEMLREKGVDHVLEFPTILSFLISHVEINFNYVESDTLQLLRLLKRYGLVKGLQLELPLRTRPHGPGNEE